MISNRPLIIDCHCHAGLGDGFRGPWDTEAPIERHLDRARAAGIDRTVVFPIFNSDYADANRRLARIVARHPGELIGFAALNPARDAGRVGSMIGRAVEQYGFRGVNVHGLDSFPKREVLEVVSRYRIPMLVDVVGRVAAVEMIASQYPEVTVIVPHLGGFSDDWMVQLQVIDQLCRYPNVYADTSGVRYWDALRLAVQRAGAHKVLFGSDGPQLHPSVELHKIRVLGLPPEQERLVTGGNIARLLGIDDWTTGRRDSRRHDARVRISRDVARTAGPGASVRRPGSATRPRPISCRRFVKPSRVGAPFGQAAVRPASGCPRRPFRRWCHRLHQLVRGHRRHLRHDPGT